MLWLGEFDRLAHVMEQRVVSDLSPDEIRVLVEVESSMTYKPDLVFGHRSID